MGVACCAVLNNCPGLNLEHEAVSDEFKIERERFRETLEFLPEGASRALEVGFNDLRMTRLLAERFDVVGIDLPRTVKLHGNENNHFNLAFTDVKNLPFTDGAFDVTVCCQVLEHLPAEILAKSIAEPKRVSRLGILITVPYRQRVWNELFKCVRCGYVANAMDHKHYFDESILDNQFYEYRVQKRQLVGTHWGYAPDWMYSLAARWENVWRELPWKCPGCGDDPGRQKTNLFGYILQRIIWRLEKRAPTRPTWMFCSYSKSVDQWQHE